MKTLLKIIGLVVLSTIFFVTCKKQESIKGNEQMTLSQKIARFTRTIDGSDLFTTGMARQCGIVEEA